MYSKEEVSAMRQGFWTAFGMYMGPVPNAEGDKINWVNYKTGVKHHWYKMKAEGNTATISFENTDPDHEAQVFFYNQMKILNNEWLAHMGNGWTCEPPALAKEGTLICSIYTVLHGPDLFHKEDWPQLISFFKNHLISFDAFWCNFKYAFRGL